jgi:LysR family nitrogen assimilation transcriptional regulator
MTEPYFLREPAIDLRRLEYFVAVAEAGSFSKAAAALVMSQPALSQQIATLEQETGHRLLTRTGRGAEPTAAGLALLQHARGIFELAERARADMRERQLIPSGRITIGLPPRVAHAMTADLVERFRAEFPDAAISVEEGLSIRLREGLVAGRLDVAVLFDPPASPLLDVETVARESLVLMASTPLPARIRLADVAALPLVLPSKPNSLRQLLESEVKPRGYNGSRWSPRSSQSRRCCRWWRAAWRRRCCRPVRCTSGRMQRRPSPQPSRRRRSATVYALPCPKRGRPHA